MRLKLLILLLFLSGSTAIAQTIHRDDLKNIQFAFSVIDNSETQELDLTKTAAWGIAGTESQIPDSVLKNLSDDLKWFLVYSPDSLQTGKIQYHDNKIKFDDSIYLKEFYGAGEIIDLPHAQNILTVWEEVSKDSIKFIHAFKGFGAGVYSASWVKFASIFPDSSICIYSYSRGADGGDVWESHVFSRYDKISVNNFYLEFLEWDAIGINHHKFEYIFDLNNLLYGNYKIFKTCKFITLNPSHSNQQGFYWGKITDSLTIDTINLWQLAQEKCNLK